MVPNQVISGLYLVLTGLSKTTWCGGKLRLRAWTTSEMEAHSAPKPLAAAKDKIPRRELAFKAMAFRIKSSGKAALREARRPEK
jgi:hypothetical protein